MPNNPDILMQAMGTPFLTAPDGTTAPTHDGTQVDVTGVPLTVAPELPGVPIARAITNPGFGATITAFAVPAMTIGALFDMSAASVGRMLRLVGAADAANNGDFVITAFIGPSSVVISNPAGVFPDASSGFIGWQEIQAPSEFDPGDPLTNVAERSLAKNIMVPVSGPAGFGDFNPIQPSLVTNDASGVFGRVQAS